MISFIGEHTCKLDAKGRVMLPSTFKKKMTGSDPERFVIKKDIFVNCLVLYPMEEWERQSKIIRKKINPYNKEHNMFLRRFFMGMAEVTLDASNRLLIPKRLLDEVEVKKEVILAGQTGKIEIWAVEKYNEVQIGDQQFASMAESIMEGLIDESDE
ncbi:MAG: division/cell wall cluster transcriptional repressor MraZ [Bacteroidales bacterium]|nr:division/cell wall cluster transcriptional repressor MraZ [Bacteroidales bacterium]